VKEGGYNSQIQKSWEFSSAELKPSSAGYERVIADLGVKPEQAFVIGDSLAKDIEPAMSLGAVGSWARYGMAFREENYKTVLRISPWSESRQHHTYRHRIREPDYEVNSFAEIRQIIKPAQPALFE
jgi:FMN phosphatase YigB (HAD superfamily)